MHKERAITIFSSGSFNASVLYGGDRFFESYLHERFVKLGIGDLEKGRYVQDAEEEIDILKVNRLKQKDFQRKGYIIVPDWVRAVLSSVDGNFHQDFKLPDNTRKMRENYAGEGRVLPLRERHSTLIRKAAGRFPAALFSLFQKILI